MEGMLRWRMSDLNYARVFDFLSIAVGIVALIRTMQTRTGASRRRLFFYITAGMLISSSLLIATFVPRALPIILIAATIGLLVVNTQSGRIIEDLVDNFHHEINRRRR